MNPLAAFQVLVLAMAAAMAVEAFKPSYSREWRIGFWVIFGILAIAGIATNQIAAAWPAASSFMAWAVSSPVTIFLAFITWVIVLQRPWRRVPASAPVSEDAALKAEIGDIEDRLKSLEAALGPVREISEAAMRSITAIHQNQNQWNDDSFQHVSDLEQRIGAAVKGARDYAEGTGVALRDEIQATTQRVIRAIDEQDEFQAKMEAWVGNLQKKIRLGLAGVDKGFAAIIDRENLLEMAANIQDVGDELTAPSRGEPLGDWGTWQAKSGLWHKAVEAWARLAAKHRLGVVERVFDTPRSEYKQKWGVEDYGIFADHDAVHDYKTLCIISRNFHVERQSVDQCLLLAAFAKPSMKVKFDPDDPDDADLLSTEPPQDQP